MAASSSSVPAPRSVARREWCLVAARGGGWLMLVRLATRVINLSTAGWLGPWLKSYELRQIAGRMRVDGRRLRYTGSGLGIGALWAKIWVLSALTFTLYYWLKGKGALDDYLEAKLDWADAPRRKPGEPWCVITGGGGLLAALMDLLMGLVVMGTAGFALPWMRHRQVRRWARETVFEGRRIRYTGSALGVLPGWLGILALSWVTGGLYFVLRGSSQLDAAFDRKLEWAEPVAKADAPVAVAEPAAVAAPAAVAVPAALAAPAVAVAEPAVVAEPEAAVAADAETGPVPAAAPVPGAAAEEVEEVGT